MVCSSFEKMNRFPSLDFLGVQVYSVYVKKHFISSLARFRPKSKNPSDSAPLRNNIEMHVLLQGWGGEVGLGWGGEVGVKGGWGGGGKEHNVQTYNNSFQHFCCCYLL